MIQATWRSMTWQISSSKLAPIGTISSTSKIKKETDSNQGQTKINGRELQTFNLKYNTSYEAGTSPRDEYKKWESQVGLYGPLYLAGLRFGPKKIQLQSVSMQNATLDERGRIRTAEIELSFKEYPDQVSEGDLQIIYKDKDIYSLISVKSCIHDMYSESQADTLTLIFNDTSKQWDGWQIGKEEFITVKEGAATTGKLYIHSVKPSNGDYTLQAMSVPPTALNKTSKSWEKVKFEQLCKEIATRHELDFIGYNLPGVLYDYVVQDSQEDFIFLETRCKLEGCAFLVYDGTLVVYHEQEQEAEAPQLDLKLDAAGKFDYTDDSAKSYKQAIVANATMTGQYTAPDGTGSGTLRKEIKIPMNSQGEANRFAQALLRMANKTQKQGTIDQDIQRALAAGSVANLQTDGASTWNGPVFISHIRHDYCKLKSKIFIRKPLPY